MNRIYKVIWNEALNCFTAVGEYAKGRGKSSKSSVSSNTAINTTSNLSTIKTLRLSAIGLGLLAAGFGMQTNATGTENHHDGDYTHSHGSHGVHTHTSGNNSHNNNSDQNNPEGSITLNFEGDNPTTITRSNGETLNILGGATGPLTDGNIGVFGIGNTLTIKLAEDLTGLESATFNGGVVISATGVNAGNKKIVNVDDGLIDANSKEAVNGSQLKALDTIVADIDFPIRSSISQPYTTSVTGTNALAVGSNANANGSNSTVVGENAFGNSNSTVIGEGARSSFNGFAGGQDAKAGVNSVAIGQRATNGTSASRAVAIGYEAKATANDTVALGLDAQAQALGGVALGKGSRANALNSVALGQNSIATVQSGASFLTNVAADANNGTVSVGAVESERRIINVAGGSADTDAVNVSQLKAVTDIANEGWNISAQGNSATASNVGPGDSVDFNSKNNNIAVSKNSTSNDVSFELNNNLDLGNNGSVSTGNIFSGTQVNRLGMVTGGLAMGGVTTVSGAGVTVTGINPFNPSNATLTSDGLTILNGPSMTRSGGINAGNKKITNVKAGTTTTDAVNYGQLENVSNVSDSAMQTVITQINGNEVKTLDKTDNTANFLTGNNIVLSAEDGGIKVATAENVTFTSVTAGDTLLNTGGVSFLGSNTVRLSSMGLNNGGNRITEVADAIELDDAVNLSQLNGVTDTANRGWDISAQGNSATASNVGPGEAVDFNSKNSNIIVSKDSTSNDVSFELNNDLDLGNNGSVSTGNIFGGTQVNRLGIVTGGLAMGGVTTVSGIGVTVTGTNPLSNATLTSDGLSMVNGPSITKSNGINAGNKKVTNVKAGVLDKDAVNVGQLNSSAAAAKTEVAAGTNVADVVKSTGQNVQDVYTVNADGVTASAGSSAVTVTAGDKDELTNMTDYAVDLSADSKASLVKADSAMQTVITQIDGNEVKTLDKTDNTANFLTGDNIVLSAEDGGIKVATAEDVTFTSVTAGDTLLKTGGVSFLGGSTVRLSSIGINNGGNRITEVADGEDDTDAVNIRQLNATNSTVDLGLDFTGDDTTVVVNRKLGQTLTIQGGATELTDNNIGVVADEEGNLNVKLAEDVMLGKNGSVRMESTVLNNAGVTITDGPNQTITLSNEGLDNGNNRIIKVGEGIAPTDAVNFAQLTTTNNEIAKGIKIGDGNSDNDQQFALGDTINVTGDSNLTTVASANGVQVKLNNQLDLGDEGSMQIGNSIMNNAGFTFIDSGLGRTVTLSSRGLDNGGNIIRNVGRGELNSDAVNVGQLREVTIALDRGWDITAQGDIATQVRQGDAIDLNSRDGNIKVSRTLVNDVATFDASTGLRAAPIPSNANDISFDLSPDITLNSVTTGDTTINDNGLTIAGGPSVTKSGIDAADTKITNIQNGEVAADSQDAVNGSQLYAQGSGISSIIGGNTVYNPENGTFINNDIGGTGQGNIDGAIASIRQGTIEINGNVQVNTTNITSNTTDITTNTTNIATNTSNIATNTTNITTNTTNINTNTDRLDAGLNFGADSGDNINKPVGDESVLSFTGGNNITTTAEGSSIKFDLNGNISVDSVTAGTTVINSNGITMQDGPSMTAQGLYAGNQRITGVADGIEATDAVNYSQLSALDSRLNSNMSDLGYRIDEVEDDANAGISAAMAMSALPQAYIAGKSLIGGGVSTYNGESAVAIGFSKLSNDGRWVIKVNGTADTQGNVGGAVGAGFHFD
ncbi:ESPR-type extended signal peptide-containing protein [Psychrobacter sp. Pi2-51]|uniref:ESPR-type extended signal peptide-containing protein n=1 Tax=Psychrobacter sp. Pi2-51 TaxID=2774132 RepID=UPI00191B4F20|nr:YadA-like family protein [Psychrobacter sp. Pi2-51]